MSDVNDIGLVLLVLCLIASNIEILLYPTSNALFTLLNYACFSTNGMNKSIDTTQNATTWIQSHLTSLYENANLPDAFDQTFSPDCQLRLNHAVHSLETFKDELATRRAAATHVSVAWDADIIAINDDSSNSEEPAVVAGAFVVTRSLPIRVRVTPVQRRTDVHFSAKIEVDPSVQDGDRRRITSFYYTSVDSTPPIHFHVPRTGQGQ